MKNRAEIKAEARALIRSAHPSPLAASTILLAISLVFNLLVQLFSNDPVLTEAESMQLYIDAITNGDIAAARTALSASLSTPTVLGTFINILGALLMMVLSAGLTLLCMRLRRRQETRMNVLAEPISMAGRIIWCSILLSIKIALWSLLLLVPGIIAAYRYRFAIYNLLDNEHLSAGQAIRLSCRQTQGMKGSLFMLDLSFLGWMLLNSLTMGILQVWVQPYLTMCELSYFEEAQRRMGQIPSAGGDGQNQTPPWEF